MQLADSFQGNYFRWNIVTPMRNYEVIPLAFAARYGVANPLQADQQ